MAAEPFRPQEWKKIMKKLDDDPDKYGFPRRAPGSVLFGSFNIRKLGNPLGRNADTWNFLKRVCQQFDLIAIQEVMDNLGGVRKLRDLLGGEYGLIVSDKTGAFPGEPGLGERLAFLFRWRIVRRTEVATDVTYDRSKVLNTLGCHWEDFNKVMAPYSEKLNLYLDKIKEWEEAEKPRGPKPKGKPRLPKLPVFLTFIRTPFCVSFEVGDPLGEPYQFMVVNAHLYFGTRLTDRRQEFDALMEWIIARVKEEDRAYYPNFLLLGDLNLDFNHPDTDRPRIERAMKELNDAKVSGDTANINFPFLDIHRGQTGVFRTNARLSETFDQIGLFSRDSRLPTYRENEYMGQNPLGPDYGAFNFVHLFCDALGVDYIDPLTVDRTSNAYKNFVELVKRFEHKVSDHIPLWLRLPLP